MLRKIWSRRKILAFLAVMGPGIITANVDNDANGIAIYSIAGASFGYKLLWVLLLTTVALIVVQEMTARMGTVTGKGLSDLIREQFGVRATVFAMSTLLITNWANTVGDFAGIAGSLEIFGVSRYLSIPIAAVLIWLLVLRGRYHQVERAFLLASLMYITYIISAILAKPPWKHVFQEMLTPTFETNPAYLTMIIAVIGTTIAPWMQFYQQSSVVDKGLTTRDYPYARADTILGVLTTQVVAFFIIVACAATLFVEGISIQTAEDAAKALAPLAGRYASWLFAIGLLNAALFSVAIIPLSTAYSLCEAFGWEAGLDRTFKEAPVFYGLYTGMVATGAVVILIPGLSLIPVMVLSQALNGILLPVILVYMLRLTNNRRLMGNYTNSPLFNLITMVTVFMVGLSALLLVGISLVGMVKAAVVPIGLGNR